MKESKGREGGAEPPRSPTSRNRVQQHRTAYGQLSHALHRAFGHASNHAPRRALEQAPVNCLSTLSITTANETASRAALETASGTPTALNPLNGLLTLNEHRDPTGVVSVVSLVENRIFRRPSDWERLWDLSSLLSSSCGLRERRCS